MARYLIFGGTGSLGKKLIERLLPSNVVVVYSRDESKHWSIKNELADNPRVKIDNALRFIVGDIRDKERVREAIEMVKPTYVIIAAALKHVDTCELSPYESVATNLLGTQNVISVVKSLRRSSCDDVKRVLFVSTDKACSPVNVYGMCKAISERVTTSVVNTDTVTEFLCTRYGNVLESRGSIIPLFRHQAEHGEFLTVTDPDMTRYLMTLDDSVDLISVALERGKNGETWIPKLPAMRIGDLAELYSEKWNKPIKIIGLRPGEKKHEDLINESESVRTRDVDTHYVIDAAYKQGNHPRFTYTSADNVLSKTQLREHLVKLGIFDASLDKFKGLAIEEIMTNRKE